MLLSDNVAASNLKNRNVNVWFLVEHKTARSRRHRTVIRLNIGAQENHPLLE